VQNVFSLRDFIDRLANLLRVDAAFLLALGVRLGFIWLAAWLATRLVRLIARRIVAAVDDGDDSTMTAAEKRGHTIASLLRSVGRALILVVAGLLTLAQFINIAPLLAGVSILGLAVSFGAQSLVKDVIAGFFILFENQFAVGDIIEILDKKGTVERMTLRVVQLRDLNGALHTVPNGQITTVSNLTRGWGRAVVEVDVGYDTDVDRALKVLRDEAARFYADPEWRPRLDGAPEVPGLEALGERGFVIRTLLRSAPGQQCAVGREFRLRLKRRLDAEGIEIPFPQRTVHVRHHGAAAGGDEAVTLRGIE